MPALPDEHLHFGEIATPFDADTVVDFVSDLHLQADDPATLLRWEHYLQTTPAQALFLLGDLFEVWIGDDAMGEHGSFESRACANLREAASRRACYFMQGNRDFLVGEGFSRATGIALLHDPTAITLGEQRVLLTHGDILCIDDVDYQQFRQLSRSAAWQQGFLAQPLAARRAFGRKARQHSESRKSDAAQVVVDLDHPTSKAWLHHTRCTTLLHGHTHKPGTHDLGDGQQRLVLSDWDMQASPPRAEILRWQQGGLRRIDWTDAKTPA